MTGHPELGRLTLMNNLTGPGPPATPCRDPSIQGRPPQLAGRKGAHRGLSGCSVRWLAMEALSKSRKYITRRACRTSSHAGIGVGSTLARGTPEFSAPTHGAARHGLHARVRRGRLGRCWWALAALVSAGPRARGATVSRASWRTGSTRCTRSLHGAVQGCARHPVPSQSERREGWCPLQFGGAVGSNSGHHPAKDLNLLSRFHALGILHARFEKPSLHSALHRPSALRLHCTHCLIPSSASAPSPRQRLFCVAPLTPFALPSSDLQPSLRAASICDTSPAPEDLPHHHTTLSAATEAVRTR